MRKKIIVILVCFIFIVICFIFSPLLKSDNGISNWSTEKKERINNMIDE